MFKPVVAGVEVAHSLFQIQSRRRQSGANIIKHFFLDNDAAAKKSSSLFPLLVFWVQLMSVIDKERSHSLACKL